MIDNNNTRLDQFVKESLNSNQIPFNESDWADMESRLNSKPSSNLFRKWSFSINTIIGLVVIGGVSLGAVYTFSGNNSETKQNPVTPKTENVVKTNIPLNNTIQNTTNTVTENPALNNTVVTNPVILTNTTFSINQNIGQNQKTLNTTNTVQKTPENMTQADKDALFGNNNIDDGNQTLVFPDQIDPKDGNVLNTQEPDCTKIKINKSGDAYNKNDQNDSSKNGGDNNNAVSPKDDSKTDANKTSKPKKTKKKKTDTAVTDTKQDDGTSKTDSTQNVNKKRNKNDNPKYKNKNNPNDPYSD